MRLKFETITELLSTQATELLKLSLPLMEQSFSITTHHTNTIATVLPNSGAMTSVNHESMGQKPPSLIGQFSR